MSIMNAYKRARKAIEALYGGVCNIVIYDDITDPETHLTEKGEVVIYENIPCKLSFETLKSNTASETYAEKGQGTKLFLNPELTIPPGAKIVVEQNGVVNAYSLSGEPAVYPSHQEVLLELFERWA